jgi:hypothetical protein
MRIGMPDRSTLAAVAAAALLAGTASACATNAIAAGSGGTAPSTTSTGTPTVPPGLVARATSQGTLVPLTGYRVENGGRTLLVYHTGVNGGCANYQGVSSETSTTVWVGVVKVAHKIGTVCPMWVTTAHLPVTVTLTAPLGTRAVIDITKNARVPLQTSTGGSVNPGGPMVSTMKP